MISVSKIEKTMKFELKKISYNKKLSQETSAFTADIYCNGKKAGYAQNNGCGSETACHLNYVTKEKRQEIFEWIEQQPSKVYSDFTFKMSLDLLVDDLLSNHLEKLQKKNWCKNSVVFRIKGDKDSEYRTLKKEKGFYTSALKDFIIKTYPNLEEIVNESLGEMPILQQLQVKAI